MQDAHSVFIHLYVYTCLKTLNLVPLFFKYKHQICVNQHQIEIYSKCDNYKGVCVAVIGIYVSRSAVRVRQAQDIV